MSSVPIFPRFVTLKSLKKLAGTYQYNNPYNCYIVVSKEDNVFEGYSIQHTIREFKRELNSSSIFYLVDMRTRDEEFQVMYALYDPLNKVTWDTESDRYWY